MQMERASFYFLTKQSQYLGKNKRETKKINHFTYMDSWER